MTYLQTVQYIKNELANHYPKGEITSFISMIFKSYKNLSLSEIHLKYPEEIEKNSFQEIEKVVAALKQNIPIQYILGETEFYNLKFLVSPGLLIPRPETEELVDWIVKENDSKKNLRIFDIGSGSGCIAICLDKNLQCKKVISNDISKEIIQKAKENAKIHNSKVKFMRKDIFQIKDQIFKEKFDIIVSNPPYVTENEKKDMHPNVLDHEPAVALFVEDFDPLKFYKAIGDFATRNLKPGGELYFEINENYGTDVFNLLLELKFVNIILKKDIHRKDRMIKAMWKK